MNLTPKTSKSFLLFKRAWVLLCFVLCSLVANAGNWNPALKATFSYHESKGMGKVYVVSDPAADKTTDNANTSANAVEILESGTTLTVNAWSETKSRRDNSEFTFNNLTMTAVEFPGSIFQGWYDVNDTLLTNNPSYQITGFTLYCNGHDDQTGETIDKGTYKARFTLRNYAASGQSIGIITLDAEGNVSSEVGGSVSTDGTNWSAVAITGGNIVTQPADDQGKKGQATFYPRFYAQSNAGYKFIGWATTSAEAADIYANHLANPDQKPANPYQNPDGIVSTAEQGSGATPPSLGGLYAVYAPSIYYYHLGAAVGIAGDPAEWEAKGRVYADNGEAVTTGVPENQWKTSMQDETVYSQENEKVYKYTYYAKVLEPTKVAFKGWTTSPNGEPSYFSNPLVDYEHTVTDDNTAEIKPFRTPTLYAVFESYYYKTPAVAVANNSKGAGFVNVSLTEGLSLDLCTKEEIAASTETHQVPATGTSHAYKVAYYAKNKPGTKFEYWSSTPDGSNVVSYDAIYVEDYETSATNADFPHVAPALYAVFSSDIDIRQQDRMIVYIDDEGNGNINDSKVLIDFQKGNTLTATLSGSDASYFTLSNRSGSKSGNSITFDATQGLIELVVAYQGDLSAAVGKVANITLSATSGGQDIERPVTIVVEEAPIITFLPTDGKGAYKVSMTNGSGINYTMNAATKENIKVPITHESMSNIEIALQSDVDTDDYYFFGWQMIDGNDVTYLSYEQLFTYQFTKPVTVRADFVHKDIATYYIVDDPTNTLYHDFALVMSDAEKLAAVNGTQTVMLNDMVRGVQVTKAVLPKGNYTIPTGVRFIVPGKKVRTYREALEQTDFTDSSVSGSTSYKEYIRWIVEEGTSITVEGGASVSVLANVIVVGASNPNGLPYDYGHIELNQNCKMEFLGDSKLFAYGYVTGPESSSIMMKDQSLVKETLQAYDWRGGTATSLAYLGRSFQNNKIFLINQYFVQNIEAPLTITAGATEELDAALNVNGIVNMSLTFISQNNGFFQLSNGYSFTKYYDKYSDRIRMTVEKEEGATGTAELGSIALNVTGIGEINSADFVLPLPHNYDVVLGKNTVTNILHDIALLPGATVYIMEGATCNLGVSSTANLFVYDQKYSKVDGKGYMGSTDAEFFIIKSRPDKLQYTRTSATIQDAKLIVDGTLNTPNGYVYTTNAKTEEDDHACITSNGGGKMQFNALGTKTDTKQATHQQYGINVISIPVAPARLLHGNGTYQEPSANTTYTYINKRWTANTAETEKPVIPTPISNVPVFTVTNYTTSSYVGKSSTVTTTISTNNTNVDWAKVTWTYQLYGEHADQFAFAWTTKPNGKFTFTPESDGTKKATLRIIATYKYKDTYGVTGTYTYSKDIYLTGNASYLNANKLAFADLTNLYNGMTTPTTLFESGTMNNTNDINISKSVDILNIQGNNLEATILPKYTGTVTITATQDPDYTYNVAGTTITKTITITKPVIWNWGDLYFGTVNEDPVTILNDELTNWTLKDTRDDQNIVAYDESNHTATIVDMVAGKYKEIQFTFTSGSYTETFESHVYANPRHLRVDVNSDTVFTAVTLSANDKVDFHDDSKSVQFTSSENTISQWKMTFIGVPDKVYFTPQGANTWQIEESNNGVNWTTSMPWKYLTQNVAFEMSLLPSTKYVRISYGAGPSATGRLNDFYITELAEVKADVDKLYVPVEKIGDSYKQVTKEVVLTYANVGQLSVTTSNTTDFKLRIAGTNDPLTEAFNIAATTEENPFGITGVEVISNATTEQLAYLYVYQGKNLLLQIPIQTYLFPQELPIKLATDKPDGGDRFYYVATHMHNTKWDGTDGVRMITMDNAVSDAAPYVDFAFKGNPTYISFDYTASAKGLWNIEESTDGKSWSTSIPAQDDVMAGGKFYRTLNTESNFVRVIYESAYAEKVDITNLTIVGGASVVVNPTKLKLDYDDAKQLTLTAINLTAVNIATSSANFTIAPTTTNAYAQTIALNSGTNPDQLGENKMGDIILDVKWTGEQMVEYGTIVITNPNDNNAVLATVELTGIKKSLTQGDLGIHTGVPTNYTLNGTFDGATHRPIDISAAFSTTNTPLFDYVVIYGETTTNDGQNTITTPNKNAGSNAKTPCYIYETSANGYVLKELVENANSKDKVWPDAVTIPTGQTSVSMYITGFCPYASTGYTKDQEGVWYFRADGDQNIHVYLQDCYLYSRAKTIDGHTFVDRSDGHSFVDMYVRGSGGVLVFACNKQSNSNPMHVTIHTLDNNLLKSNYGCFLQSLAGRAFQASSPVQIRLISDQYWAASKTVLNFTDEWPASQHPKTGDGVRTNGFLSLQKQVNNAPSIDMGNPNTVVNFNGGQVELQNAQIVSHNYKSSLAICPRSGKFAEFRLAYGMGTDDVGGTVNFKDGTTTVLPMWVSPDYFENYLCDKDNNNNFITNAKGEYLTTCLRTPTNTFVSGGSHCMMRACKDPSSQGGAPKDKAGNDGKLLGLYKFPKNPDSGQKGGWSANGTNGLVTPTAGNVPGGYSVNSVTPNNNETPSDESDDFLNFWFDPDFEPAAQPEVDKTISYWKTCMTTIGANYAAQSLTVGGETEIAEDEIVKNLLYCKIDDKISEVIYNNPDFVAPVKNPAPEGEGYIHINPNVVGGETKNYITNEESYQVENKVYYITTATADIWNAFTAPFDVANIYIMETYPEEELDRMSWDKNHPSGPKTRDELLTIQAEQNAYFAGFCAVTIALKQNKNFERMYDEYMDWARLEDIRLGFCDENTTLAQYKDMNLRGMRKLIPYNGTNWATADFYLNENTADWKIQETEGDFVTEWAIPDASDGKLLEQGKTYSMLLPYCTGCDPDSRDYWDYWTGKFIIFESTDGSVFGPHTISGTDDYWNMIGEIEENETVLPNTAKILGNTTFDQLTMSSPSYQVLAYSANIAHSTFFSETESIVEPTMSFMLANIPTPAGVSVMSVSRDGMITYSGKPGDGTTTGTHTPTVGGGNDMFITAIAGGINVAVAAPQFVQVVNATGHIIYCGYVANNVDVILPMNGIYVVKGENEAQKIFF